MRTRVYSTVLIVIALAAILWLNEALRSSPPGTASLSNARLDEPIKTNHPSGNPPPSQTTNLTPTQISQTMKLMREEMARRGIYTDMADILRDEDSGEYLWKNIGNTERVIDSVVLEQVIFQMQKGHKVFNDLNQQLGLALYRLDPVGWRDTLFNAGIRLDHIDRIPEIAKLRPVAHEQMPQQKNLYWR